MIWELIAAFFGTIAFSIIFHVPKKFYPYCGMIGAVGWAVYYLLREPVGIVMATLFATIAIVFISRFFAVRKECPVTIFLISGIFSLVPGAGVYWTAYYLVVNETGMAGMKGMETLKVALAIVLGIVLVFELPQRLFHIRIGKKKSNH